ncbi:MFS transporter [Mangrovihabitans endophyticus]|uniref:MFS transporter n=1 Tax=Mangrovihabitans endophyticus TaxID=1751298 RepID=A0A8J3C1H4_9ACTN|nr:MFS transporter [Mangrovihabitans endophyticus]GGK96445.1 MFS transporter [Mangrovihabitans endophyticus]
MATTDSSADEAPTHPARDALGRPGLGRPGLGRPGLGRPVLGRRVLAGYAVGSLVTGAFGTVPGLLLLPYLTDTLGVAAGVAGLLVLLPKAWDVLINPVAGRISDRRPDRRPFLLIAGLALAVLFAAMFAGPFAAGGPAAAYVALAFLATATAFAFFQVPYVAMPAELTDGYAERTRLMTWRVAVLALAILVSGALAPLIVVRTGDGLAGHRWAGLFVATLIAAGTLGVFGGTRGAAMRTPGQSEPSWRAQLAVVAANRSFRALLLCFVIQSAGIATMLAGVQYFADHVIGRPAGATVLFAAFVGPALLVMPLWSRIGRSIGKLRSMVVASLLFAAGALALLGAGAVPPVAVYLIVAVIGVGYAGQQVFALAMLPDRIAHDTARTGRRQAGVFTGLWTAGETFGLALGPGIFALVLQLSGYESASGGVAAVQDDAARLGILLGFSVIPAALVGMAVFLLRRYDDSPAAVGSPSVEA